MSIRLCSVVLVSLLLAASMAMAAATDPSLAEAVKREDRAAVRALLKQKVDANAPLSDGSTALHWAVESEDLETVGLLINAGANVNAKNRYSVTPLHVAVSSGNAAIV